MAERWTASGPVTDVLLTHRDHAAHGRRYADHFGAWLWIHEDDLDAAPDADQVIRGLEPLDIAEGVTAHPLPGHTRGSVLYLADDRYCFSGDSFFWSRTTADREVAESVIWHRGAGRVPGQDGRAAAVRVGAAGPRGPAPPAGRRDVPAAARPGGPHPSAAPPPGRLHRAPLVSAGGAVTGRALT
ncbi:hypothetical protein GCM10017687_68150 [Streptomyces echinatus]|uniref:Metallo-beta-lactamase domain-containing protein n=1 Tax=Streptomyces echinatus TaxID=67293 RepID=A0A7W9Q242_9ACTN|nr:hypothetical protein [Streptomyces echinatus]